MRTLSWHDVDVAVEQIATSCVDASYCGIHGVPRGGLVLAVCLSHRLALPLLAAPQPGCLVVDDVYKTGLTLAPYRQLEGSRVVVWISKAEPQWWQAVEVVESSDWIVFPWENPSLSAADEQQYRASRT